jgi:hypothetical protein
MSEIDYREYYNDESYLLEKIGPRFRSSGMLDAADFLMILVWKANRAVSYHVKRLVKIGNCTFDKAVSKLAESLHSRPERRQKLELLITEWEFALPTATAILAILYPDEFTVYDVVVCGELEYCGQVQHKYRPQLYAPDAVWNEYETYHSAVVAATPAELSLRDKDRYLTGHAYHRWLQDELLALSKETSEIAPEDK